MVPISVVARVIIFLAGWHPLDPVVANNLHAKGRRVLVFSHTSYWDFYVFLVYLLAYYQWIPPVRSLVKPQPFTYAGGILTWLGAIPSTKIDEKNGGAVDRIVKELQSQSSNAFMISPKGTILKAQWRSGYYHIAQKLQAPISVIGLDYELHCVRMSDEFSCDHTEEEVRKFCYSELSKIVPLHPENENMPIRHYDRIRHGLVGTYWPLIWSIIALAGWMAT